MGAVRFRYRRAYRIAWCGVVAPLALAGSAVACLAFRLGALLLAALVAAAVWAVCAGLDRKPPAPSISGGLLGLATLTVTGMVLAAGAAGWWVVAILAATGWPALRGRRRAAARTGPAAGTRATAGRSTVVARAPTVSPAPSRRVDGAPVVVARPTVPLPGSSDLSSLSTAQLCWAWRVSYLRLLHATGAAEVEQIARLRGSYLDELQRRDPAAAARWLPTARAAGDPSRSFCGPAEPRSVGHDPEKQH